VAKLQQLSPFRPIWRSWIGFCCTCYRLWIRHLRVLMFIVVLRPTLRAQSHGVRGIGAETW